MEAFFLCGKCTDFVFLALCRHSCVRCITCLGVARRGNHSVLGMVPIAAHSSFSPDGTGTSTSSSAASSRFSGTAQRHVCATRRVSLVPMTLVSQRRATAPSWLAIACFTARALPLRARCFAEGDRSLRHRSRRNQRSGCTWHRRIPRELVNRCPRHLCHKYLGCSLVFETVPQVVSVFCCRCMRLAK